MHQITNSLILPLDLRRYTSLGEAVRAILVNDGLPVVDQHLDEGLVTTDLDAVMQRDPAAHSAGASILFYKGFKAVQAYRMSHDLWRRGTEEAILRALYIQSRVSQIYSIDIHPGAVIGPGFVLDHGTGTVIGETALIGANCTLMHSVTLGSSSSSSGQTNKGRRHPSIAERSFIGAGAILLGNITIGPDTTIGAGSIVTKSFPLGNVTLVGNPAAPIVGVKKQQSRSKL